jgi:hypothetical protein
MRKILLDLTTKPLESGYFSQTLLPAYLNERQPDWGVHFDARGNLIEPHTGHAVALGTRQVENYLNSSAFTDRAYNSADDLPSVSLNYPTTGPANRFRNILFIEKEGFMSHLKVARIAERYDVAIMSTKGQPSTAARRLIEGFTGQVRILVLHDFDKSGFSILAALYQDTKRYHFERTPEVIDLGLRLKDVTDEGLDSEPVSYGKDKNPTWNLRQNGGTKEEVEFLVNEYLGREWRGQRVELNAFTAPHFIDWLERKLKEHKVEKVIPSADVLKAAFRRASHRHQLNTTIREANTRLSEQTKRIRVPQNLGHQVAKIIEKDRTMAWDDAMAQIVRKTNGTGKRKRGS